MDGEDAGGGHLRWRRTTRDVPHATAVRQPQRGAHAIIATQRFAWDPNNGNLFLADIGQNIIEKVTLVTPGANLWWNLQVIQE